MKRPRPFDLAKQATHSVTEIVLAEADRIGQAWDDTFGRPVLQHTGKPIYGGFRWHAFSWGFTRAVSGEDAIQLYAAESSVELFVIPEETNIAAFKFGGCVPVDFGPSHVDLYVLPATLDWTMVFTHEQPHLGPFFCRREWVEAWPWKNRRSVSMNCRYFACNDHREYVDAGYRWAYWTLEDTGVVKVGHDIDVDRVLATGEYWNPADEERNDWLCGDILLTARSFLEQHAGHHLMYVEEDDLPADFERIECLRAGLDEEGS